MCRDQAIRRFATAAFLAMAGIGLAACEQMADLIPDSKKPLPGERKLLFPEGVPGVTQGVPPEMMRGNQQAQGQPGIPGQTGASTDPKAQQQQEQQQAEEKPKPTPKPKAQRTVRQQPRQEPQAEPAQPQQQPQQQQTSPWPAPQQSQPAQASPWPSAPAPGTFTR